jgi:inorganic triphosphatase YgiF
VNRTSETELKLRLPAEHLRRVTGHPVVRAAARGAPVRRRLVSVYYDTADFDLSVRHMAVRLRKVGGRWLQTVKADGQTRLGLHERPEWEHVVPGPVLDPDRVPDEEVRSLLATSDLQPVFVTDFWRTTRMLQWKDGSEIELALDRGEIRAGEHVQALCEVELELKRGQPQSLYDLALAIAGRVHLSVENRSKAERGYALLAGEEASGVRKAAPAGLTRDLPVEDAFAAMLFGSLEHLDGNRQAVVLQREAEGIHQMRVALRRLRAALGLFRALIPRAASRAVGAEAKWLNGELGAARDWDVLTQETLVPLLRRVEPDDATHSLEVAVRQASEEGWRRALAAVESPRYTALLLTAGQWLVGRRWREAMTAPQRQQLDAPLPALAAEVLEDRHRKLRKAGRHIGSLTAEERHALRIRVKKLRYASDYLAELYPRGRAKRYVNALTRLQTVLGALNDGAVARVRLAELGLWDAPAGRLVQGWHACQSERWLADLPEAWGRFAEQDPFWH